MKTIRATNTFYNDDCTSRLLIDIDGVKEIEFIDGEAEDNNLSRNFGDCYSILGLLEKVYNMGKEGVDVEFKKTDLED